MSFTNDLIDHYREVRARLRRPPNAVADTGINLRREPSTPPEAQTPELKQLAPQVIDYPKVIPFRRTDLTLSGILDIIAVEFNITSVEIRSRRRTKRIAWPRQVAIYLAFQTSKQNTCEMGRYLRFDHTTVMHGKLKVQGLAASNKRFQNYLNSLERRIRADFHRPTISTKRQPHLDSPKEQQNRSQRPNEVGKIPVVDTGSRSTLRDAEAVPAQPDLGG